MLSKVTKQECLTVLQEGGLNLKDANAIYNYFANDLGIEFLMLEFILTVQEEDPENFATLAAELEEQENV